MNTTLPSLRQRIQAEGENLGNGILKIDGILNHQIIPELMGEIGKAFASHFTDIHVDRILTAEISGIAPAVVTGIELGVPVVYARKKKPITMSGPVFLETAPSHTKGGETSLLVSAEFMHAGENVLIIDDFLASGQTLLAMTRIVKSAGAHLVGVGCVVEKSFEDGRNKLLQKGYTDIPIVSLATITSMDDGTIELAD
jgi:xanthine phosphoribosyltransferase